MATSNPSKAVCKPIAISPRLIFLKIQVPSHAKPIKIAEPAINKLLSTMILAIQLHASTSLC